MLKRFIVDLDRKAAYDENGQLVALVAEVMYTMSPHTPYSATIDLKLVLHDEKAYGMKMQPSQLQITPNLADIVTADELRAAIGLPPLENQQGEPEGKPTGVRQGKPRRFGQ